MSVVIQLELYESCSDHVSHMLVRTLSRQLAHSAAYRIFSLLFARSVSLMLI